MQYLSQSVSMQLFENPALTDVLAGSSYHLSERGGRCDVILVDHVVQRPSYLLRRRLHRLRGGRLPRYLRQHVYQDAGLAEAVWTAAGSADCVLEFIVMAGKLLLLPKVRRAMFCILERGVRW